MEDRSADQQRLDQTRLKYVSIKETFSDNRKRSHTTADNKLKKKISKLSLALKRLEKKVDVLQNVVNRPSLDALPEPVKQTILEKPKAELGANFDRAEIYIEL